MSDRIVSPCRVLPAVLIALVGFAPARAADKNDKYTSEKPTIQKSALRPSLTGKLDAAALARAIDGAVDQRLAAEKVHASPRADDAEFLRRVYLDLAGHIPPAAKATAFLESTDPAKRAGSSTNCSPATTTANTWPTSGKICSSRGTPTTAS